MYQKNQKLRMKSLLCFLIVVFFLARSFGQQADQDTLSIKKLEDVVVKGYEQNRRLNETAGAVGLVNRRQLEKYGAASVLPAINAVPGVRMEERSPGSYRLNIRGSSLRSPFGVRNVKVYYNDIPYTDPGGNTYFNVIGFHNVQSIEILKGPAASMYGAGTGGVLRINNSLTRSGTSVTAGYT